MGAYSLQMPSRLPRKREETLLESANRCITNNASDTSDFDVRMLEAVRYNRAFPARGTVLVNSLKLTLYVITERLLY